MAKQELPEGIDTFVKKYVGEGEVPFLNLTGYTNEDAERAKGPLARFWKGRDFVFAFDQTFARVGRTPDVWRACADKGGKLLVGDVPNELVIPWSKEKHPGVARHYTPRELTNKLNKTGWQVVELLGVDYQGGALVVSKGRPEESPYLLFAAIPAGGR